MRRNRSPRPRDRPHLDPELSDLCPEAINISSSRARAIIASLNAYRNLRNLEFRSDAEQLELVRLEALRLDILQTTGTLSVPSEEAAHLQEAMVSCGTSTPVDDPAPLVPRSVRTRATVLSESEISVLDIGPSLTAADVPCRSNSPNSTAADESSENGPDTSSSSADMRTGSDISYQPSEQSVQNIDAASVAITSSSGSVNNDYPLSRRERRRNVVIMRRSLREIRLARRNQRTITTESPSLRGDETAEDTSISSNACEDEANRQTNSPSVPPSLQDRAQGNLRGVTLDFLAWRGTPQIRNTSRDAPNF